MELNEEDIGETDDNNKEELSLREILLRQIKKIGDLCEEELVGGFFDKVPVNTPGGFMLVEKYSKDTRVAYIQCVDFITDLIYADATPENKKIIENYDKIQFKDIKDELKAKKILFRKLVMMVRDSIINEDMGLELGVTWSGKK